MIGFVVIDLCLICKWFSLPPKGGWGFMMCPPCLESQGVSLIPLFYISCFVLPSPVALSVYPFLLLAHSPDFFFSKPPFSER